MRSSRIRTAGGGKKKPAHFTDGTTLFGYSPSNRPRSHLIDLDTPRSTHGTVSKMRLDETARKHPPPGIALFQVIYLDWPMTQVLAQIVIIQVKFVFIECATSMILPEPVANLQPTDLGALRIFFWVHSRMFAL